MEAIGQSTWVVTRQERQDIENHLRRFGFIVILGTKGSVYLTARSVLFVAINAGYEMSKLQIKTDY